MKFAKYFLLLTFGLCGTTWAQLRWDTRSQEFNPPPTDKSVIAEFPFTNTGGKTVTITDVTTSCGCTTTILDKKVYAPGEKGKITAIFYIGARNGLQEKTIHVASDDPKEPTLDLQLKVTIQKLLGMDNTWLTWARGEELKPKIVNIKVLGNYPIHHLAITSSSPDMATEVRHVEGTRDFQLVVTPGKADGKFVTIDIVSDYPKDSSISFHVYARTNG